MGFRAVRARSAFDPDGDDNDIDVVVFRLLQRAIQMAEVLRITDWYELAPTPVEADLRGCQSGRLTNVELLQVFPSVLTVPAHPLRHGKQGEKGDRECDAPLG